MVGSGRIKITEHIGKTLWGADGCNAGALALAHTPHAPERDPFLAINPIQHRLRKTRSSPSFVLCLMTISAGEAN